MSPAACAQQLAERFPALFAGKPKPLKLRIQADIQERAPGVFTKQALSVDWFGITVLAVWGGIAALCALRWFRFT